MLITDDKQVLQDIKMFPFMFAWVQQCKIVIQIMSYMAVLGWEEQHLLAE